MIFFRRAFYLQFKQLAVKKVYYITTLLMALLLTTLYLFVGNEALALNIGLQFDESSVVATKIAARLLTNDAIHVKLYESEGLLAQDVSTRKIECGYIISKDADEIAAKGSVKGLVQCMVSPSTIAEPIASEIFFAAYFEAMASIYSAAYLAENGFGDPTVLQEEIETVIAGYYESERFLLANYTNQSAADNVVIQNKTADIYQSMIAIFAYLMMYLLTLNIIENKKTGLYRRLLPADRIKYGIACSLSGALFTFCLTLALTQLVATFGISPMTPLQPLILLLYLLLLGLLSILCALLFNQSEVLYGLFPVVAIVVFLFGGALIDLSVLHPAFGIVQYLFPSTYYVMML